MTGDWRDQAACIGAPDAWFFPSTSGDAATNYPKAAAICRSCPVRTSCLQFAIDNRDFYGMFGGYTPEQRANLRRRDTRRAAQR